MAMNFSRPADCSGSVGPRRSVKQRELGNPLGRLPQHGEGDVAAHRQAGERETRRRIGEDARGDRRHVGVAPVIGDGNRPKRPKRRDLRRIKPRAAKQSGHQNER